MILTHNGITYEPPVTDKEHQDYIDAKVEACNDVIMKDAAKFLSTFLGNIKYVKKSWYKRPVSTKYSK